MKQVRMTKKELTGLDSMLVKLQIVLDQRHAKAFAGKDSVLAETTTEQYKALVMARAVVHRELDAK